nr:PD40 domain-containing protein [candidate division Zixibacteria bacterium]
MIKKIFILSFLIFLCIGAANGQTRFFGQNKVQYKAFEWQYLQTRHFDVYFADQMYETAKFSATVLESAYVIISDQLNYHIHRRIPVFIYNSPNDFQQTNITSGLLPEGVGGFTEVFKNRITVPFNGSTADLRHVLHHELTHAVTFDMLFGNIFSSLISRQRFFEMPLWLAEGYAEYSSRFGWDYQADMVVRDATINNYLAPLEYISGYMAYKEGQALINFIADNYGERKIGEIFAKGKIHLTINKALKSSLGITSKELYEEFSKEMKRRYWPDIAKRQEAKEFSRALTNHSEDGSGFNGNPIFSPKGDRLAIFSTRKDYTEVYLISAIDGKEIDRLVKAERSGDLESLHSYYSGITFSPDGEEIAFVAKSHGRDAIYFLTIKDKNIYQRKFFEFNSILHPHWSPDGKKIAFAALNGRQRNIVVYDIENNKTYNLTDDTYDDDHPSWFPDSKHLAFSSDRPHPDNAFIVNNPDYQPTDSLDYRKIYSPFGYGNYNLFMVDIDDKSVFPIHAGPGINTEPDVAPDGKTVCFVSNRNGIDNLYIAFIDSSTVFPITDILTGANAPSWSPDGKQIAFQSFNKGGFDIFVLKDWKDAIKNGRLEPTDFMKGKYDYHQTEIAKEDSTKLIDIAEVSDSTASDDSLVTATAPETGDSTTTPEPAHVDTTRIEGGDFVFVSNPDEGSDDPLAGLFEPVHKDTSSMNYLEPEEKAVFDSIATVNKLPSGEYKVHDYRVKFTPDYVNGGFSYDTFYGLQGNSIFVFSDYLGDHQIYLITDLVNTIDQTNLQVYYFYNRMRTNYGVGLFHTKNYYIDAYDYLFSDRMYGFQGYMSRPFSQFFRVEGVVAQYFIDRKYHDADDIREDRSAKVSTATLSLVQDNIIWGITGPLNGRRSRLDFDIAYDLFGSDPNISFYATEFDYRKYWHIKGLFSFAVRGSAGISWGDTPKRYFLGGTPNKIENTTIDAEVYDVENLYFSETITPLRGYEYFDFSGDRYFLANFEFRYPFVDYLKMNFPLPMTIGYVTGNIFYDIGSAWNDSTGFKGATSQGDNRLVDIKSSFGFGIRANLGIFVLRYDLAWATDLATVAAHPKYYFSIGADF